MNFRRKTLFSTSLGNVASVDSVRSEHQAFRHLKLGGVYQHNILFFNLDTDRHDFRRCILWIHSLCSPREPCYEKWMKRSVICTTDVVLSVPIGTLLDQQPSRRFTDNLNIDSPKTGSLPRGTGSFGPDTSLCRKEMNNHLAAI